MPSLAIEGMEWGDEGKGKITDYLAAKADVVVRSQGGNNAGHSVEKKGRRYALRLLPSGVLQEGTANVLADGMAIDPSALLSELDGLSAEGLPEPRLLISDRAAVLLPYHVALDRAREAFLGKAKIGTTGRGIGPCYEDAASRIGLRMGDLLEPEYLRERLSSSIRLRNLELASLGEKTFDFETLYGQLRKEGERLAPFITDTSLYLRQRLAEGKKVLFEGAQGAMLCLLHGTYPYVTSSSPLATAIPLNAGLPLGAIDDVLGIVKAYATRVGEGPFPTEIADGRLAGLIREKGHEYGTVTKRPRRIGWLDAQELRYVIAISGVRRLALTLLDVLSDLDEIRIAVAYRLHGQTVERMPATIPELAAAEPVFETLPSWKGDISGARRFEDLPIEAQGYVREIERLTGLPVDLISVGPDESATIARKGFFA